MLTKINRTNQHFETPHFICNHVTNRIKIKDYVVVFFQIVFQQHDTNRSGYVDEFELGSMFSKLGQCCEQYDQIQVFLFLFLQGLPSKNNKL